MSVDEETGLPRVSADSIPAVTAAQMREVDRVATQELGLGLIQMMENAGRHLAELAVRRFGPRRVAVLAGSGGNGGGGLVAARHLVGRGVDVAVTLAIERDHLDEVPRRQLAVLERAGVPIDPDPSPADLVLDAVIGYALEGDPRERAAELIRWANDGGTDVCALDVPSGLDATSGRVGDPCVRATATLTLALPKTGLAEAPQVVGETYLGDLAIPAAAFAHLAVDPASVFATGPLLRVIWSRIGAARPTPDRAAG